MSAHLDEPLQAHSVDLVFPLGGHRLPRDSAPLLSAALQRELPWLEHEPMAGIHPLKLVPGTGADALLSHRTRLLIRLPRSRLDEAVTLAGRPMELNGSTVTLGEPHPRELLPHRTLYAHAVAAEDDDESAFMQITQTVLDELQIRTQVICGKRHQHHWPAGAVTTFSLMLHGLTPPDSLRLQELGLGRHRLLGCGIFVPHKSAAAVGD